MKFNNIEDLNNTINQLTQLIFKGHYFQKLQNMHSSQVHMEYSLKKILSCYETNSPKVQLIKSYKIYN